MKNKKNNYWITKSAFEYALMNYNIMKNVKLSMKRKNNGGGLKFEFDMNHDTLMKAKIRETVIKLTPKIWETNFLTLFLINCI